MMMALGAYRFSIHTAAYQAFKRSNEYRWASTDVIGRSPVLQGIGIGPERIELEGVIYPHFKGGFGQVEQMRASASNYTPHLLVDGQGYVLGKWVITHIEEAQACFLANGLPKKITFRLSLEKYSKK